MEWYTYVLIFIIFIFCMSSAVLSFTSKNEMDKFEKDKFPYRKEQAKKYSKWAMYAGIVALVILVIYGILFLWWWASGKTGAGMLTTAQSAGTTIGGKFSSFGSAVKRAWNNLKSQPGGGNVGGGGDGNGNGGGDVGGDGNGNGNWGSSPLLIEDYSGVDS